MSIVGAVATFLIGLGVPAPAWMQPVATRPAAHVARKQVTPNPSPRPVTPSWARCGRWWDTARAVGWPEGALGTLDGVMWNESNCKPWVTSSAGAAGLTQLMSMWWHGRNPYDPATNLSLALDLYRSEGGFCPAWRGDPAVGRC